MTYAFAGHDRQFIFDFGFNIRLCPGCITDHVVVGSFCILGKCENSVLQDDDGFNLGLFFILSLDRLCQRQTGPGIGNH